MSKKKASTKVISQDNVYWKQRYDTLCAKIQELHEYDAFHSEEQPVECISLSDEFYISNSLEIVDNIESAMENWGEGKFFRVFKEEVIDAKRKADRAVEIDYEGMGTCIEAYVKVKGKQVCTIGSNGPEHNNAVSKIIKVVKEHLEGGR